MTCGRFAPSPTGLLHFGSMVAAIASYLDARSRGGKWLVRMEDVDKPREQAGAAAAILRTLERFGFEWDGEVMVQSRRTEAYRAAFEALRRDGLVYPCACNRREVCKCRDGMPRAKSARAWRARPDRAERICFEDRAQGTFSELIDDFVVLRADGLYSYQIAVVVDDAEQGVTTVVRGADLLDSTPRQLWLQKGLGYARPEYLHVPVAVNANGQKLSKQTLAPSVDAADAAPVIRKALEFLGQPPSDSLPEATQRWDPSLIPREVSGFAAGQQQLCAPVDRP